MVTINQLTQSIHEISHHHHTIKRKPHNVGAIIIYTCLKPPQIVRFKIFGRGTLRIYPLDGQIKGEVVVGTTNGDNLGGSSYLSPFITIGLTST